MKSQGVGVWHSIIEDDAVFYDASQQTVIVVGFCMNYCLYNWWINTILDLLSMLITITNMAACSVDTVIITRTIILIAFFALCVSCPKQSSF